MSPTFDRNSIRRHPLTLLVLLIAVVVGVEVLMVVTRGLLSLLVSVITTGIIICAVLSLRRAFH